MLYIRIDSLQSCNLLRLFLPIPGRRQGRSLEIRPHPAGCEGRAAGGALRTIVRSSISEGSGGSAPAAGPYPKVPVKVIKNRIKNLIRFLTPNGLPKGPSKSQKSDKICKLGPSNTFGEVFWPLSCQKGFPSHFQRPPEPQKWWFHHSKTIIFRNPI